MSTFVERLFAASQANQSLVCVGLDPDPALMPVQDVLEFNMGIVDATKDLVAAYKPNLPFYEALGIPGLAALQNTIAHIRAVAPGVVVLGDGKRGDIGSTNSMYAKALFEIWDFDAATINAYAGGESLEPFFDYGDKGVFVWCHSSNPGAKEFQELSLCAGTEEVQLYEWIATKASEWNANGNVGLVMGSTYPEQLKQVRMRCPGMPILVPGVGSQGGDLEQSVRYGLDSSMPNILINSSRGILYASGDRANFASAARDAAGNLRARINRILAEEGREWLQS